MPRAESSLRVRGAEVASFATDAPRAAEALARVKSHALKAFAAALASEEPKGKPVKRAKTK